MISQYTLICLLMLVSAVKVFSEEGEYSVDKIPKALLKDANAVIRVNEISFEVLDKNSSIKKVKFAATIFKKDEQQFGRLILWYDKFREIDDLEGKIYDRAGKEIRELDDRDIKDYSGFAGYTFYDDNRVRVSELFHNEYPYTIEFKYTISYDENFNWPTWYSRSTLEPVEKSRFEVVVPENDSLRYWCNDDSLKPLNEIQNGKKFYIWEKNNLVKLPYDVYGDDLEDIASIVRIAPAEFEIEGYAGSMNSWKEFGSWYYSLCKDRMKLPETVEKELKELVKSSGSEKEKMSKVYYYMQSRTRYVSVQLGIGSWQPFEAEYVHTRGYGDCKALSNYMVSLLNAVGIKAYPVLINSGDERLPLISQFPSNQFNHVIVCIPGTEDTTWLECTSQNILFGVIDADCENREALMITPDGGIIVNTPSSSADKNIQMRKSMVKLTSYGTASAEVFTRWSGNQHNNMLHKIIDATPEEREKLILSSFEVPEIKLNKFDFKGVKEKKDWIELSAEFLLTRYANASGTRIFFYPNIEERRSYIPKDIAERHSPVRFYYPYIDIDTAFYSVPKGYSAETLPGEVNLESTFGKFSSATKALGDTSIVYTRFLEIDCYSIPAKNYPEYRDFFAGVVKSDRDQVVLVKKK